MPHLYAFLALIFFSFVSPCLAVGPSISLKDDQILHGRFVHEHPTEGFDRPLRSEGQFSVTAKDKIVWAIEKPMATTTTITSEGLTQSVGTYPLLRLTHAQMPFLAHVQQSLMWALSGQWDKLKKDYIVQIKGDDSRWEVTIKPKEGSPVPKPFQSMTAQGGKYVEKANILLRNGVSDHVTFSDIRIYDATTALTK